MGKGKRQRASASSGDADAGERSEAGPALLSASVTGASIVPPAQASRSKQRTLALTSRQVYQDLIFRIDGFLTPAECGAWIDWGEETGFENTFHTATREIAHRDNGRLQVHSPDIAAAIWQRIQPFVPAELSRGRKAAGCNANIRLYRYCVGQRFGKHIDESVLDPTTGATSEYTLLLYLNGAGSPVRGEEGPLAGGETLFYKGSYGGKLAASVTPIAGSCLVHGHGARCLLHEGALVTSGVKYLLRTDVMYK